MRINPYEPSVLCEDEDEPEPTEASSAAGPWRDGKYLVVRIDQPNLPSICPVTGGRDDIEKIPVRSWEIRPGLLPQVIFAIGCLTFVTRHWISQLLFGNEDELITFSLPLFGFLAVAAQYHKIELRIPHGPAARKHPRSRIWWLVLAIPATFGLVFLGVIVTLWISPFYADWAWAVVIGLVVTLIAFLIWLAARDGRLPRPVRIGKVDGEFAWLATVDRGYLAPLPPWRPSS